MASILHFDLGLNKTMFHPSIDLLKSTDNERCPSGNNNIETNKVHPCLNNNHKWSNYRQQADIGIL